MAHGHPPLPVNVKHAETLGKLWGQYDDDVNQAETSYVMMKIRKDWHLILW